MMASLDTANAQPTDTQAETLWKLLRAELTSGIFGLRLFIACTFVSTLLLGMVWILGSNLTSAIQENGRAILGGDISLEVNGPPLDAPIIERLDEFGALSTIVELRGSAKAGDQRAPVEIKGVDGLYPLYGKLSLQPDSNGEMPDLQTAMAAVDGVPGAVVEATLLSRLGLGLGDTISLGQREFEIRAVINIEPDRLSSRRFLVGPRVMVELSEVERAGLLVPGSLSEYRYRVAYPDGTNEAAAQSEIAELEPSQGWSMTVTEDAGDRVLRTVERTTTFLGIAGIVALAIGLTGTWSAALVWVGRRARTIALYRLSGASPALVVWLHGAILVMTGVMAIVAGLVFAATIAGYLTSIVAATLHLNWSYGQMTGSVALVFITLLLGLAGASVAALSAAHQMPPGVAMRSGEAELKPTARHIAIGLALIAVAVLLAVLNLPLANLAALAALWVLWGPPAFWVGRQSCCPVLQDDKSQRALRRRSSPSACHPPGPWRFAPLRWASVLPGSRRS